MRVALTTPPAVLAYSSEEAWLTSLDYSIDDDLRIVTIVGDYAEAAEWRALLEAVAGDPRYQGGYSFLRDVRSSAHPVTPAAVIDIITVVGEFWQPLRVHRAAVLSRPGIDPPALVAHALAEDLRLPLRAFASYDEAIAWLTEGRQALA